MHLLATDELVLKIPLKQRQLCKYKNYLEAAVVAKIVSHFLDCGVLASQLTVISPYLDQQVLLGAHLKPYGLKQVLTIDKAQGIDCEVVIISCTKQTGDKGVLLKDLKRLNVAITRAKKKLVVVGNEKYLKDIKPWDKIINKIKAEGWQHQISSFGADMQEYLP